MKIFDGKYLFKTLSVIGLIMLLCMVTDGAAIAIAIPFSIIAWFRKKYESLIFWILLLMTSIIINSYFMPKGPIYGYAQRGALVLLGCIGVAQFTSSKRNAIIGTMLGMLVYILYMVIPSIGGYYPIVSYLKIALFIFIYLALSGTTNSALMSQRLDITKVRSVYLAFGIVIILGSMMVLPFPDIGQLKAEEYEDLLLSGAQVVSLFKGMTYHSQTLGPVVVMLSSLIMADVLFGIRKFNWLYVLLLICAPYLIYTTSSRTAMGAYIFVNAILFFMFVRTRNIRALWRRTVYMLVFVVGFMGLVLVMFSTSVQDGIARFVLKYDSSATLSDVSFEQATATRQGLIDVALDDFKRKPLLGNGFQVDERLLRMMGNASGLPLSAPVEKGFWITAVLQEGGVIGFIIYLSFLVSVSLKMRRGGYKCALALFLLLHILNFGEFTMFSMSGNGGFLWTMVFMGLIIDGFRRREESQRLGWSLNGRWQ